MISHNSLNIFVIKLIFLVPRTKFQTPFKIEAWARQPLTDYQNFDIVNCISTFGVQSIT